MSVSEEEYVDVSKMVPKSELVHMAVYQLQGVVGECNAYVMRVGETESKAPHVLINQYDLSPTTKCMLLSRFYTEVDLKNDEEACANMNTVRLTLIELTINSKDGKNLIPVECFRFNFNTSIHKENNNSIVNYLSTKDLKKTISGFYSITFHHKDKYAQLEIYNKYLGTKEMFDVLIKKMLDYMYTDEYNGLH